MSLTIKDLPTDVISQHLAPRLADKDKASLARTCFTLTEKLGSTLDGDAIDHLVKTTRNIDLPYRLRELAERTASIIPNRAFLAVQKQFELFWGSKFVKAEFQRIFENGARVAWLQAHSNHPNNSAIQVAATLTNALARFILHPNVKKADQAKLNTSIANVLIEALHVTGERGTYHDPHAFYQRSIELLKYHTSESRHQEITSGIISSMIEAAHNIPDPIKAYQCLYDAAEWINQKLEGTLYDKREVLSRLYHALCELSYKFASIDTLDKTAFLNGVEAMSRQNPDLEKDFIYFAQALAGMGKNDEALALLIEESKKFGKQDVCVQIAFQIADRDPENGLLFLEWAFGGFRETAIKYIDELPWDLALNHFHALFGEDPGWDVFCLFANSIEERANRININITLSQILHLMRFTTENPPRGLGLKNRRDFQAQMLIAISPLLLKQTEVTQELNDLYQQAETYTRDIESETSFFGRSSAIVEMIKLEHYFFRRRFNKERFMKLLDPSDGALTHRILELKKLAPAESAFMDEQLARITNNDSSSI